MVKKVKILLMLAISPMLLSLLPPLSVAYALSGAPEGTRSSTGQLIRPVALPHDTLDVGKAAPEFSLINQDRKPISLSDFSGKPRFVVFIYTHCKDVCPLILQNRRGLERDLEPIIGKGVIFLGVSFDPEEDTPEVLKAFIQKIGVPSQDLHLLTGSTDVVAQVLRDYEINVMRDAATGRAVGHSAIGYAIDKSGIIQEIFNFSP